MRRVDQSPAEVLLRLVLRSAVPAAVVLGAVGSFLFLTGRDVLHSVLDPAYVIGHSPWLGGLALLASVLWFVGAAVALFASSIAADEPRTGWLRTAGVVLALAGFDDLFLVHEQLGVHVPGGEAVVLGIAGLLVLVTLSRTLTVWAAPEDLLVLAAVAGLFAVSVIVDLTEVFWSELGVHGVIVIFVEESAKICGISLVVAYVVRLSSSVLSRRDVRAA